MKKALLLTLLLGIFSANVNANGSDKDKSHCDNAYLDEDPAVIGYLMYRGQILDARDTGKITRKQAEEMLKQLKEVDLGKYKHCDF